LDELPQANAILARIREVLGSDGSVKMHDHGQGLGAVHVTLSHFLTPAAKVFYASDEWEYVGSEVDTGSDTAAAPGLEFSRWVRLDGSTF
jgi:hypothetical protein